MHRSPGGMGGSSVCKGGNWHTQAGVRMATGELALRELDGILQDGEVTTILSSGAQGDAR